MRPRSRAALPAMDGEPTVNCEPDGTHRTWCGVCEAGCGLVATVRDGRLASLRPDADHPLSQGFACTKGLAWPQVLYDPDRVAEPQRRLMDGSFESVIRGFCSR